MTDPHPLSPARAPSARPLALLALAGALAAFVSGASADPPPATPPKETLVGGMPLFAGWPANQKPDAVIVFTGQTFGFLQPCGCSRPQTGGLERRAVFIESLKAKGWPVVGIDLGDLTPEKSAVRRQGELKYKATMNALREMGYVAVGVGKTDISADLMVLLGQYAYQEPFDRRPVTLAGNAVGVVGGQQKARAEWFGPPEKAKRPVVDLVEVAEVGKVPVGVAGVVSGALAGAAKKEKIDPFLDFGDIGPPNNKDATLTLAADALAKHPKKPQLNVLIFQGSADDAAKVAKDYPQFGVILCRADDIDPLPPLTPKAVPNSKTVLVQVGHKGQHVGVLGAFKQKDGSFALHYQLVPMGEEYLAPADGGGAKKVLGILEEYAKDVQKDINLKGYPRVPHAAQIYAAEFKPPVKLGYVGSEACKACHAKEFEVWAAAPHAKAMDALEKTAKRPSLRQYDGECVKCHVVGFENQTGYTDEKATPHLKHVGCESCHGPGSGHAADPKNKGLTALLSEWKRGVEKPAKMPDAPFMEKMAKLGPEERNKQAIEPDVNITLNRVSGACMKCHDADNDPHFDIYKYWPRVAHSGLAPAGGWPAVPPK